MNGAVNKVFISANNTLYAGGDFTASGSTPVNHIAKWNGTSWEQVGDGFDGGLYSIIEG